MGVFREHLSAYSSQRTASKCELSGYARYEVFNIMRTENRAYLDKVRLDLRIYHFDFDFEELLFFFLDV